jgi:hypothetical protein
MPGGVGGKLRVEPARNEPQVGGGELPLVGVPVGIAHGLELLQRGQLRHVDLARELGADGVLERVPRLEVATRKRPGTRERRSPALPEQHAQRVAANLEDDGERDVCGSGPWPAAAILLGHGFRS